MPRMIRVAVGALALGGLLAGCATSGKAVIEQYQSVTPTRFEGAVAVVLEDRAVGTVDDQGESLVVEGFKRIKILDRKALDCGQDARNCRTTLYECYDETWETIEEVEARTITPEGVVIPVPADEMTDQTMTTWDIPDQSQRCKVWMMKGATPGSIFEEKYRIRSKKFIGVGGLNFQERDPVLEVTYTLDTPTDFAYTWKVQNADIQPTEEKVGNRLRRTWTAREMAPIIPEPGMIPTDDVVARLVVANQKISAFGDYPTCKAVKSWEDFGNCWQEMIAKQQELTEPVKEIVKRIGASAGTETEKLKAVWDYMNTNIRYVGLERGLQGYIPLSAHVVCDKKYGDCKAVAGLITVLCRALGLKADPILIGMRPILGALDLDLPGPFHFNHSIARVEADGKVYWMDATTRTFDYSTTPYFDQGVDVVVARPGAPFMDKIPVQPPESNVRETKVSFAPAAEGAMTLELDMKNTGNFAGQLRAGAMEMTADKAKQWLEGMLSETYPGASLLEQTISGKEDNNLPVGVRLKASLPKAIQATGTGLTFEVRDPFGVSAFDFFNLPKRRYALDLNFLREYSTRFEVQIPAGMQPAGLPKNVMLDDEFLKLERLSQIENDRLVTEYRLVLKMLIIPADRYPAAREAFLRAQDASKFVVLFEPVKQKGAKVGAAH
jgi:transglutaminase-like putative cysteine protease